jgi:hypothetical protein
MPISNYFTIHKNNNRTKLQKCQFILHHFPHLYVNNTEK